MLLDCEVEDPELSPQLKHLMVMLTAFQPSLALAPQEAIISA